MAVDHYQLRIIGLHETQYNEVVCHWRGTNLTAADYIANADDLCKSWDDTLKGFWLDIMPQSYQLLRLAAKKASPGGGGEATLQYQFGTTPGNVSGGAAAQQLCPVIGLIPPMGIKSAGRMFLPAIPESMIASNVVSAGWLSVVDDLMLGAMAGIAFSSITWDQAIYSRKNTSFAEVVDYTTSPIVGFMRKRQRTYI
jgi:hypothetical protein